MRADRFSHDNRDAQEDVNVADTLNPPVNPYFDGNSCYLRDIANICSRQIDKDRLRVCVGGSIVPVVVWPRLNAAGGV